MNYLDEAIMEEETEEGRPHAAFFGNGRLNSRLHSSEDLGASFRVVVGGELSRGAPRKESEDSQCHNHNTGGRRGRTHSPHYSDKTKKRKKEKKLGF